ncbi:LuxR family transcriptional regulator [Streptomyces sp. UNOC14_S4]|uniref:helix-turn-helix transcriptional regulator n=1 Tax=Streptomyces sp. UNOC14_S4 TaxID=2872340 RepID=UPI001E37D1EF|nr:LuxR family transcriptional regulator [Streptomyces sp. UNOC14_S4]
MPVKTSERDTHLTELADMLGSAEQGRGRLALISGPVACGKTDLLDRFAVQALARDALLLETTGSRSERELPFGLLKKVFDNAAMPPAARAEVTALLDGVDGDETDAAARLRVMSRVSSVLLRLAEERTLVVTVDDVHWGDAHSLQFLLHLARRVRQSRVLVVLTESTRLRQEQLTFHVELLRQPNCGRLRLHMLTEPGVSHVLTEHVSSAVADRLAPECHRLTGGNPLLLRALLEDWRAGGEHGESLQRPVPGEAYAQALLGCLHRGTPDVLAIAQGVAVLGDAGCPVLVGELLGLTVAVVEQGLQDLHQCAVLEGGAFRGPAARAAVLDAIPAPALAVLHRRAAELRYGDGAAALDTARHLVAARQEPEHWAVPVLREAAEYALVEEDLEFALRCLELAHAACGDAQERAALQIRLVSIAWRLGPAIAETYLPRLVTELEAGRVAPRDMALAASYLAWSGRLERAAEVVARVAGAAGAPVALGAMGMPGAGLLVPGVLGLSGGLDGTGGGDAVLGSGLAATAHWLTTLSPPLRARIPTVGAATAAATGPRDLAGDAHAQSAATLNTALTEGQTHQAVVEAERVLQRYHLSDSTLQPLAFALLALVYADRLDLAQSWCERLLGECATRRVPSWQALLSAVRAEIALRQGDLPVAAHQARTAIARISPAGWGVAIGLPLATLIQAETGMGRHEEAMALLEQPVPDGLFHTLPGLHYLRARGRCHLATGRFHAALGDFMTCGELMSAWRVDTPQLVPWRLDAAEAWLALDETARAHGLAEEQLRRSPGNRRVRGALLLILARGDDLKRRLPRLKEAVEILEDGGDRLQLASALGELGMGYRALGDFNRARVLVRKAWHVAKACGAEPLCRQLIPGHGDGFDVVAADGQTGDGDPAQREVEALTEAEARVALLAAHGNTNREIASKLFVTVSTVEQHLTRIYRKLKVKRRRDLPAKLADSSLTGAS